MEGIGTAHDLDIEPRKNRYHLLPGRRDLTSENSGGAHQLGRFSLVFIANCVSGVV